MLPRECPTNQIVYADYEAADIAARLDKARIRYRYYPLGSEHAFVLHAPVHMGRMWFDLDDNAPGWVWQERMSGYIKRIS